MLIRTGFLASGRAQEVAIADLVAWSDLGFATNKLGGLCLSTPAISDGTLFFRTTEKILAVGFKK